MVINYPFGSERQRAEDILKSLRGTAKAISVEADLSTATGPAKLVEAMAAKFGSIDILVNNAGVSMTSSLTESAVIERGWLLAIFITRCGETGLLTASDAAVESRVVKP